MMLGEEKRSIIPTAQQNTVPPSCCPGSMLAPFFFGGGLCKNEGHVYASSPASVKQPGKTTACATSQESTRTNKKTGLQCNTCTDEGAKKCLASRGMQYNRPWGITHSRSCRAAGHKLRSGQTIAKHSSTLYMNELVRDLINEYRKYTTDKTKTISYWPHVATWAAI